VLARVSGRRRQHAEQTDQRYESALFHGLSTP
jgi:hypothetical protein